MPTHLATQITSYMVCTGRGWTEECSLFQKKKNVPTVQASSPITLRQRQSNSALVPPQQPMPPITMEQNSPINNSIAKEMPFDRLIFCIDCGEGQCRRTPGSFRRRTIKILRWILDCRVKEYLPIRFMTRVLDSIQTRTLGRSRDGARRAPK